MFKTYSTDFLLLAFLFVFAASASGQKISVENIVAKHLDSIAGADARAAVKTRVLEGKVQARTTLNSGSLIKGKTVLASDAERTALQMSFDFVDYTGENINFDGKTVNAAFATTDRRSALGSFTYNFSEIVKGGFFGGALLSSWALIDADKKISKSFYEGKEKIGDREVYVLRVVPRNGSTLNIKMYFDVQSFRHLRTRYHLSQYRSPLISSEVSSRQSETRYLLIEDFSDFKSVNDLTLPTTYKVTYTLDTYENSQEFEWVLNFSRFAFNSALKPQLFAFK